MAKAAPKPKTKAKAKAAPQGDYSHLVDSMNVFPTSDRRPQGLHPQAAAGALPRFTPSCSRRALRLKDGLGGRTASWSRRGTASCASCPCPSSTSAAPRRGRCPCYVSVLAGKAVSAEDHRLAVNTANVMGWESSTTVTSTPTSSPELPDRLDWASPARMKVGKACTGRAPRTSPRRSARSSCPSLACT